MRDSFVMYTSYLRKVRLLGMEQRGILFTAILKYEAGEELPEMDEGTAIAFAFIQEDLDQNRLKYEETCAKNRAKAEKRWKKPEDAVGSRCMPEDPGVCRGIFGTAGNADNDNDTDTDTEKKKRGSRMKRPTLEEVRDYCREIGSGVDPEKWLDYYEANGWKVGKNPMKDWKACVRRWSREEKPIKAVKTNNFTAFESQHSYDWEELERSLSKPMTM